MAEDSSRPAGASATDVAAFLRVSAPEVNPFINRTWGKLSVLQRLKVAVLGITIFPLRAILTLLILLLAALFALLGTACLRRRDFDRPLPLWRRILLWPIRPLLRIELAVLGVWVTVNGTPAPKAAAPVVVSNHVCLLEPLFLVATLGACPVSARENLRFPVIAQVLVALQCVFVVRDKQGVLEGASGGGVATAASPAHESGPEAVAVTVPSVAPPSGETSTAPTTSAGYRPPAGAVAQIAERARDGAFGPVLVFPEGTCTNGSALVQFKSGAFAPGLPVQPVAVRYPYSHFDPSWAANVNAGGLLMLMMCQLYTCMHVTYLPVVAPTPEQRASPSIFANDVRATIAACLPGTRITQHSFDDIILAKIAVASRYPLEQAVVEINRLRTLLSVDTRTAAEYLKLFMRIDTGHTGVISVEQFVDIFSRNSRKPHTSSVLTAPTAPAGRETSVTSAPDPQAAALRRMFQLFDANGDGRLDYREFLIGLCIVNERGRNGRSDALRLAFEVLDTGHRGSLDRDQFGRMIAMMWPNKPASEVDTVFAQATMLGDVVVPGAGPRDGRLSAAQFIAWGEQHGRHSAFFRETFLGFSGELGMLAAATDHEAAGGMQASAMPEV